MKIEKKRNKRDAYRKPQKINCIGGSATKELQIKLKEKYIYIYIYIKKTLKKVLFSLVPHKIYIILF